MAANHTCSTRLEPRRSHAEMPNNFSTCKDKQATPARRDLRHFGESSPSLSQTCNKGVVLLMRLQMEVSPLVRALHRHVILRGRLGAKIWAGSMGNR